MPEEVGRHVLRFDLHPGTVGIKDTRIRWIVIQGDEPNRTLRRAWSRHLRIVELAGNSGRRHPTGADDFQPGESANLRKREICAKCCLCSHAICPPTLLIWRLKKVYFNACYGVGLVSAYVAKIKSYDIAPLGTAQHAFGEAMTKTIYKDVAPELSRDREG